MDAGALDWLKQLSPSATGYAAVGGIAVVAFIVWRIARRIVQLGYFVLYCFVGFGIVYCASAYATKRFDVPLSMPILGGLAFAAAASVIRAKMMRIVSAVMLIALFTLGGKFWAQYATSRQVDASGDQKQAAAQALAAAKRDWGDIVESLPKKNGVIVPGWVKGGIVETKQKPVWHTWLTGLYDIEREDFGIWTSGGTPEQAKKALGIKRRD